MSHSLYYPPTYTYRLTANQFRDWLWETSYIARDLLLSTHAVRANKQAKLEGATSWRVVDHRMNLITSGKVK